MAPWKVQRKTPSLWLPISDSSVSSVGCGQVTSVSAAAPMSPSACLRRMIVILCGIHLHNPE